MDKAAVAQARGRLKRAMSALEKMLSTDEIPEFENAWSEFLLAAGGVYAKLEAGAKTNTKSAGWFGRAKNLRRKDPLLQYIHHARNSDEHGLEFGAAYNARINFTGQAVYDISITNGAPVVSIRLEDPNLEIVHVTPTLVTVKDEKYGDEFHPPTEHLGTPIADADPIAVAGLAVAYLTKLIDEADARASTRSPR